MTAEVDVYGGEVSPPKDLSNGHANVDGSYVFVNGNDIASDDPVDSDLNSLSNKQSSSNQDNIEASEVKENQESLSLVTQGDMDQEIEPDQSANVQADSGLGLHSVNGQHQESVVVNDSVHGDEGAALQYKSPANAVILPSPVDSVPAEIPVADPQVELGAVFQQNPESASCLVVDIQLEMRPATHETEQGLATAHIQNGVSKTAVVGDLSCPVDSENVDVETSESLHVAPVSIRDTPTEPDIGLRASTVPEDFPSCAVDDVKRETETGKLDMASSESSDSHPVDIPMLDNEVDNGPVKNNTVSSCLNNGARAETETGSDSMKSEKEVSILLSGDSTLKSVASDEVTECYDCQPITIDNATLESVKTGSEMDDIYAVSCRDMPGDDGVVSGSVPDVTHAENGGIQFTGEGDGKTCQEIQITDGGSDDKTCQGVAEENGEIQFIGEESDDKTCQEVEGSEESDDKKCQEVEGSEESDDKTLQEVEGIEESDDKTCQEVEGIEESDDKTCQEVEKNGGIQFTGGDKSCLVGQENGEIQFISGWNNDKACQKVEESDDKTCQKVEENREIPFTGEATDNKTCQKLQKNREIQFTGEESDNKTCQEMEDNGEIQFTGEENDGKTCQEVKEEIPFTGEEIDDKTCREIEENGKVHFTCEEIDDKTCQEVEKNGEIQDGGGGGKAFKEVEGIDGIRRDETPTSTPEGSMVDASEMQNTGAEAVKRPFYYLIKVPRYDDENLREEIKSAQLKVDEKTQSRDVIRAEIQKIRDVFKKYGDNLEASMSEEKAARELLKSKRQEIDSLQSMINKVKNAISVEDIDGRIRNMEHMIAHETLPLKEEKQFIREIKQLKQLREQFSSSMGKQDEVQQAFDQKDQIEERLKLLRKEAESLRENVLKVEAVTQAAKKKQKDESEKLKKLYTQFKVADDIRQEAYKHLQSLRKQANDKNKYFWKYKDDVKQANDLVSKGDKEALQHLCVNQVESVLELWNNNTEFRKQYVNCNIRSTLRRLKTMDGRSLGPDEVPPILPSAVNNRVAKDNSVTRISILKEEKAEQVVPVKSDKVDDKPLIVGEQKNQMAKSKKPAKLSHSANGSATVSGRDDIEEARDEEPKRTKEEEEAARKAEELRKEEEAAKLKEQRRLEEKVKAKEALERKKRTAEKAQARAVLRAQKEAEEKEKEREKRARKKEKRKAAEAGDTDIMNEGESAPGTETTEETPKSSEIREKSMTVTKRPQKSSQFTKQTKAKPIPLPLRNRGKRRMQTWMWVLITALVVVALFLLGNNSFPVNFGLKGFGF